MVDDDDGMFALPALTADAAVSTSVGSWQPAGWQVVTDWPQGVATEATAMAHRMLIRPQTRCVSDHTANAILNRHLLLRHRLCPHRTATAGTQGDDLSPGQSTYGPQRKWEQREMGESEHGNWAWGWLPPKQCTSTPHVLHAGHVATLPAKCLA